MQVNRLMPSVGFGGNLLDGRAIQEFYFGDFFMQKIYATTFAGTFRGGCTVIFYMCLSVCAAFSPLGSSAMADTDRAMKEAKRALRIELMRASGRFGTQAAFVRQAGGPNFSGRWAGRYVKVGDNCGRANIQSFLFRHILNQNGGSAALATSHDGSFSGRSRDRGRRLEFTKPVTSNCNAAVVYKNLSNNRRVSGTGYAVACSNGCVASFAANAIRN